MLSIWIKTPTMLGLFSVLSLVPPLLAQGTIQQYFDQLKGYQVENLAESTTLEWDFDSPFESQVIDEFILFHYSRWAVRAVDSTSHPALELEVYEMQDPQGAFGVFSNWNHLNPDSFSQRLNLPVDNYYLDESLIFWRGAYFFHLNPANPEPVDPDKLESFSRTFIEILPLLNLHPLTVIHLPQANLIRDSVRFYLGEASFALDGYFPREFISPLGFDHHIEVTAARYYPGNHALYLVAYPTPALAAQQSARLQNARESYFSPEGVYIRRSGVIIAIFFGPESEAQEILTKVQYAPTIKWIYQKEQDPEELVRRTMDFLGSVRQTLVLILVFLPTVLTLGFTAGIVRYTLFQLFPGVQEKGEMIQLDFQGRKRE